MCIRVADLIPASSPTVDLRLRLEAQIFAHRMLTELRPLIDAALRQGGYKK